jgi:hypothetical protein
MPVGIFLTHIAAPALGCSVDKNGDVHDNFILNQEHVFTKDNRNTLTTTSATLKATKPNHGHMPIIRPKPGGVA